MTCEWERCRRKATHEARWANGRTGRYCLDHARGVSWTHKPDLLPGLGLDEKGKAGVMAAAERFQRASQRLVDKSDGLTGVSIKAGDGPWITVAEKRQPK